ncbi:MAG: ATP-binding protein, partial [Oscillospiraceae bacterium]|nr:ATP-binding protein [Oscillospiraceae bacterium]
GTALEISEYRDCMLSGDPDRLEEVLQNIFENAIKYGDGKRIAVSFSDEEDCRLITVSNSGCTLPEEELTHIFESFWRGSNTGNKQGSGLGLYICSRLMQKMGGDIFAETEDGEMKMTVVCRKCGA